MTDRSIGVRARSFRHSASLAAIGMTLGLGWPATVAAQEASPAAEDAADDANAIVVTGFRASLESAVNTKKSSDQIVESVSAEDIGKLPDASIGESIARLPGLTAQRLFGRANSVAIRGSSADLSSTTLNGRPQTSTGEQRNVEFDQYPSEIVSRVDVYKSPQASLVHQGLVGTVDIRTIRPLDYGKDVLAIGGRGTFTDLGKLNSGSKEFGYRASGTFVRRFADDTFGVALSAAYIDEPYQVEEYEAWGYADGPDGTKVIGGIKPFGTSTQLKRLGIQGSVQWAPTPEVMLTVDGFYSDFKDKQIKRGIEFPLAWSGATLSPTGREVVDGVIVSGTFAGSEPVINNHGYERNAKIFSGGFNAKYDGDDGWSAFFDFGYSRTDRNELSLESNAGTGPGALGASDTVSFINDRTGVHLTSHLLDYSDPNLIVLTDANGWGGGAPTGHQEGYYNDRIIDDEIKAYQLEVGKEIEGGFLAKVRAGLSYVDRSKSKTPDEYYLNLANGARTLVVPQQYLLAPTDLGFIGAGPMISYDPFELLKDGVLVRSRNTSKDVAAKQYSISEKLMSIYLQADLRGSLGAGDLTGNIGVLAQNTEQKSSGFQNLAAGLTPITRGDNYWDVLPSLNLALRFPSDFVVRFAGSREIQRARPEDLSASQEYGVSNTSLLITGKAGNPTLRPYRAWAADLNFEKYFGTKGYLALQLFYKKLDSYIFRSIEPFDYTGFPLSGLPPISTIGTIDRPINGKGGSLYGAEIAGTLPFDVFTSALDGFGFTGGVSYTKSKIRPTAGGAAEDLPDYSRYVGSATLFFEKWGFNARASARYRSSFQGQFICFGGERCLKRALAETIVDAQVGYEFPETSAVGGLSLFVQGQNLTDEPFIATNPGEPLQVLNYQRYGRRFMAGFTYKF